MVLIVAKNASPNRNRREELADAVLHIGMTRGLDQVSVREVAAEVDCSIGTVQHYFHTKDEMLVFAFRRVVDRATERALAVDQSGGVRAALPEILRQLLPLDDERQAEVTVTLAFAARAATEPKLAAVQAETLDSIHAQFAGLLGLARKEAGAPTDRAGQRRDALRLLALIDGLALHAISAPGKLSRKAMTDAVDAYLDVLLA
jgi:AcrR family transcriptional regulator